MPPDNIRITKRDLEDYSAGSGPEAGAEPGNGGGERGRRRWAILGLILLLGLLGAALLLWRNRRSTTGGPSPRPTDGPSPAEAPGLDREAPRSTIGKLVARVVVVSQSRGWFSRSVGAGLLLLSDAQRGVIVTARHVVDEDFPDGSSRPADGVEVGFLRAGSGKRSFRPAVLLAYPKRTDADLALLLVKNIPPRFREADPVPVRTFGSLRSGEDVFTIGHPYGLSDTVTKGIVSAKRPPLYVQTDAPLNEGNSGGPLLDDAGRMVGISSFKYGPEGKAAERLNFAVRADLVTQREEWTFFGSEGPPLLGGIPTGDGTEN